jgi:competence protein ComEA
MFKKLCALLALVVAQAATAAVDVNKATATDLDGLNGIGPATSKLILSERKKSEFKDWPDLMKRVKGIGDARAAKLSEAGLTVGGASYKGKSVKAAAKTSADKPGTVTPVMSPAAVVTADKKAPEKKPEGKSAQGKRPADAASR